MMLLNVISLETKRIKMKSIGSEQEYKKIQIWFNVGIYAIVQDTAKLLSKLINSIKI